MIWRGGKHNIIKMTARSLKLIFLGTNGWYDTQTGNTICILIEAQDYYLILDAGSGLHKLDDYRKKPKPVYLFLSHFHLDHIQGLHILDKFSFPKGLYIFGQKGTKDVLKIFQNKPFTMPVEELPVKPHILEFPECEKMLPFEATVLEMLHACPTLGIRLKISGKIISYCPDTGYCENAVTVAKNSDLLIADCAYKSGQTQETWPHLNPETAAKIAFEAKAKKLVLVHFDASNYKTFEDRDKAEQISRKTFANTYASRDNMEIEI